MRSTLVNKKRYITARAVIVERGRALLFFRQRQDNKRKVLRYYSIPGGELDKGESPEEAVHRELREELGVEIELCAPVPLMHGVGSQHEHYIYWAKIVKGTPELQQNSEEFLRQSEQLNSYEPRWVTVEELTTENMHFYREYMPLIRAISEGHPPKNTIVIPDKTLV